MAKFKPKGRDIKKLLKSDRVRQQALKPYAEKLAPLVAAATPVGTTGGTRASVHVDDKHMSIKGDRVAVRVAQTSYVGSNRPPGGAALPLQYGNAITTQVGQFTKALAQMHVQ